ncbi:hypothetical protein I314_01672 [Cryptococcus bacillisporus CA1873]|uniref:Uncharacterized protein n=1 Tax=Cryptococcus bacillisporus CA1873 TaxID=1296111 RepID=A0ABR5BGE0_CRYGA|nr:hypothetical protein I314_01672 [Cryptococcus bacillisporus CA1873]|eukprot:KIR68178.1 hypothetical protein I314_01672 [Cryptococcus gattii CA1873]
MQTNTVILKLCTKLETGSGWTLIIMYHLCMNDHTYPKSHGHLLKPYLSSPCFNQTSPLIPHPQPDPSLPLNAQPHRILQILDDRHHQGHCVGTLGASLHSNSVEEHS